MILLIIFIVIVLVILVLTPYVPKIIHQTAPGDKKKWKDVWFKCQDSWKTKFPQWEYKLWDDDDIDLFMKNEFPKFYEDVFSKYTENIHRIDAFRYFVLYKYGGMYADMDYECIKNFDFMIANDKVSLNESMHDWDGGYQNALMISPKGHKFWKDMFIKLEQKFKSGEKDTIKLTGPVILSEVARENTDMVYTLKQDKFTNGTAEYAKHHETASWQ
jgi:mannosyltransferase OCH1-like enzyme